MVIGFILFHLFFFFSFWLAERGDGRLEYAGRRACVLHDFGVELWPVCNAAVEATHVDKIKAVFRIRPLAAAVVNLESEIWRYKGGLDGG